MEIICKKCRSNLWVKNGNMKTKQRYKCKSCGHNYTIGDKRTVYAEDKKRLVVRMYLNNCGIRRIAHIIETPLSTVFSWIKKAGKIVEVMVKERKDNEEKIEILEMDELYTYIKKSQKEIRRLGRWKENTLGYGLLWIGIDLKLFRLE